MSVCAVSTGGGRYQHKAWRKEHGQQLIDEYQRALDRVNTILPNHMQLDDLPDLGNVDIEHELMMGSVSNRLCSYDDDDGDDD